MASEGTVTWTGKSGTGYEYEVHPMEGTTWSTKAGNYIFAKRNSVGRWVALYIGETSNFAERLPSHEALPCVLAYGGTHIHAHVNNGGQVARRVEERDLIENYSPPCNG